MNDDGGDGRGMKIDPPPREGGLEPPRNRIVAIYRKEMDRQARKDTKRIIRTARREHPDTHTLTIHIWGQERQRAMMQEGWHPVMEQGADMTLTLDIAP